MNKLYAYAAAALLSVTSLTAMAAVEGVTITWDPAAGATLTEIPTEFTISFDGNFDELKKPAVPGNPVKLTSPSGNNYQCTATYDTGNKKITFKTTTVGDNRTETGEWTATFAAKKIGYVTNTVDESTGDPVATTVWNNEDVIKWTVGKSEGPVGVQTPDAGITYYFDPPLGDVTEFPEKFTITVEGCASIASNISVNPPVRVLAPGSTDYLGCSGTFSGNTVTITAHKNLNRNLQGEYIVELKAGGIKYVAEDGTKTNCTKQEFKYNNTEGTVEVDPGLTEVQYDVQLLSTTPNIMTQNLDIANKTFETLQFVFNQPGLKPADDATVSIVGPSYSQTIALRYSMANEKATWLKATIPNEPEYNGEYTLTIPKGVVGNALYFEDSTKGHANDEISFKFEVVGGKSQSEMTLDTSFAPNKIDPVPGTKVYLIEDVTFTFPEKVYFKEDAELYVGYKKDLSATKWDDFSTATIERVSDTEVKLILAKPAKGDKAHCVIVPEATFWNQAHQDGLAEDKENEGAVNPATTYEWYSSKLQLEILSTTPANHSKLSGFPKGYQIIIDTDKNDKVAKMTFSLVSYILDDETGASTSVTSGTTTEKNEAGAICWTNTGDDITFSPDKYYELTYTLYEEDGTEIIEELIEFDGAEPEPEPQPVVITVTSTTPAEGATLASLAKGDAIVINTDNNDAVASFSFLLAEIGETENELLADGEKLTTKNDEGACQWVNEGDEIVFYTDKEYELAYTLFNEAGDEVAKGTVKFTGTSSSLAAISLDAADVQVYNLQGIRVNSNLKELPAGLYIIAGKKVMVRK